MNGNFCIFTVFIAAIGLLAPSLSRAQDPLKTANEKLALAKNWSERVTVAPKSDSLVVSTEFFRAKIGDAKTGLFTRSKAPMGDLQALTKAIDAVADFPQRDMPWEAVFHVWGKESTNFIDSLEKNPGNEKSALAWTRFLRDWEHEVLRENPYRFPEALAQAGPILTGLYLDYESPHIEAALTDRRLERAERLQRLPFREPLRERVQLFEEEEQLRRPLQFLESQQAPAFVAEPATHCRRRWWLFGR